MFFLVQWRSFATTPSCNSLISQVCKKSACNAGDSASIPGLGRSAGEGIGYPLQFSWASLVAQLVKNLPAMWERPGFDPWVGKIPWRRERLPTPVFWPGEFDGLYSLWGHKESDTTERLSLHFLISITPPKETLYTLVVTSFPPSALYKH